MMDTIAELGTESNTFSRQSYKKGATPIVARARSYVLKGWSILPLKARDKVPAWDLLPKAYDPSKGKDRATWQPFRVARPSLDDLARWGRSGSINLGIVTGSLSKLLVFDADTPEAVAALDAYGMSCPEVETGRGRHYYCAMPPGAPVASVTIILPGGVEVEVKGEGSYVVAAGSIHPSGATYRWRDGTESLPLPPVPPALLALLRPERATPAPATDSTAAPATARHSAPQSALLDARRAAYVETILRDFDATPPGGRWPKLYPTACRLYEIANAAPEVLPYSTVAARLAEYDANYIADHSKAEFDGILSRARDRVGSTPAALPAWWDDLDAPETVETAADAPTISTTDSTAAATRYAPETIAALREVRATLTTGHTKPAVRATAAVLQLTMMIEGTEALDLPGGGAYLMKVANIPESTARSHLEQLDAAGVAEYDKGEKVTINGQQRHASHATVTRWHGALPAGTPADDSIIVKDRTRAAKRRAEKTVEALDRAACPECEREGLHVACECGHRLDAADAYRSLAAAYMPACRDCGHRLPYTTDPLPACPACGTMLDAPTITPPTTGASARPPRIPRQRSSAPPPMPEAPPPPDEPPPFDDLAPAVESTAAYHSFCHGIRGGDAPAAGDAMLDAPRQGEDGKLPLRSPARDAADAATESTAGAPVQGQLLAPRLSTNAIGL